MFQKKIDKIFNGMSNLFGIADDILAAGFDELGKDHNETLWSLPSSTSDEVLRICRQASLKLNRE